MKPVGGGQPVVQNQAVGSTAVAEPQKETEQVSNNPEPSKNNGAVANQMKGEMGFNGQAQAAAVAERFHSTQMNPNQPVDLSNKELRNDMLRNAPQINPIAGENGPHACGGAAMANALILSSDTPEKAKANAQAVRKSVDEIAAQDKTNHSKVPLKLTGAEDAALKRMETGKMSANDSMHLQQIMYKLGQRAPIGGISNPSGDGLSTSQIASTMAMLKGKGAFEGNSVTMHCQRSDTGFDHWTTTVDGTHVNSQAGSQNRSVVMGGPPAEANKNNQGWQGEIWLNPNSDKKEIFVQFRGAEDKPHEAVLESGKYETADKMWDFEQDLKTKNRPVK